MNTPQSVLMLTSSQPALAEKSGYNRLSDHVSGIELVKVVRQPERGATRRIASKVLSSFAVTNWYQVSSAELEYKGWQRLRHRSTGIVHMLWGDCDLGYMDSICRRMNVPLCCTFHGCPDSLPQIIAKPERLKSLDAVIVMSTNQREYFLAHGVPAGNIHFIPHGIDTDYYRPGNPKKDVPAARPTFKVLSVGSYRRNFPLLRSVCDLFAGDARFSFEVISSRANAKLFEGAGNVRFRSGVPDEELLAAYQNSDCLLMTAEASTANNVVLEAMACGLPIVGETLGGISEYVNAECSLLTAEGVAAQLAESLRVLAADAEMTQRMSRASRARALALDWSETGRTTQALYQDVMDRRRKARAG